MGAPFSLQVGGPFGRSHAQADAGADASVWGLGRAAQSTVMMDPSSAVLAQNCTAREGLVRPLWGPGSSITHSPALSGSLRHFAYLGGATNGRFEGLGVTPGGSVCYDGAMTTGEPFAYFASPGGIGRVWSGFNNTSQVLGDPAPTVAATAGTGVGTWARMYRYTYVRVSTLLGYEVESNPSPASASLSSRNVIISVNGYGADYKIRIYATPEGITPSSDLPFYFVGEYTQAVGAAGTTQQLIDPGITATNQDRALEWDAAGSPGNPVYPSDHSPPFTSGWQTVSNALHTGGVDQNDYGVMRGILLASTGGTIQASENGNSHYFPTAAWYSVDQFISAIRTMRQFSFAFGTSGVFRIYGSDPYALDIQRLADAPPILLDSGNAAQVCPWGILYPSKSGLQLLTEAGASNITKGILPQAFWASKTGLTAAYADDAYIILDPADNSFFYAFDLRGGPEQISVVKIALGFSVTAISSIPRDQSASAGGGTRGCFIYSPTNGLRKFEPFKEEQVSGATPIGSQIWRTPMLNAGSLRPKHFASLDLEGGGGAGAEAWSVGLAMYRNDGTQVKTATLPFGGTKTWKKYLPPGFRGDLLQVTFSSVDPKARLHQATLSGVVLDGRR